MYKASYKFLSLCAASFLVAGLLCLSSCCSLRGCLSTNAHEVKTTQPQQQQQQFNPDYQDSFDHATFFQQVAEGARLTGDKPLAMDLDSVVRLDMFLQQSPDFDHATLSKFVVVPRYWMELAMLIHDLAPNVPRPHHIIVPTRYNSSPCAPVLETEYLQWLTDKLSASSSDLFKCFQ